MNANAPTLRRRPVVAMAAVCVAAIALLGLLAYGLSIRGRETVGGVPVRAAFGEVPISPRPASPFTLGLLGAEGQFSLAAQRGSLVLVDFWASWCQPCRDEAPGLQRVATEYQAKGVVVLGINVFDTHDDAVAYVRQFGLSYANTTDPQGEVAIEYGLAGVPEKFLIDRDGRLVRRFVGPMSEATLRTILDNELASTR